MEKFFSKICTFLAEVGLLPKVAIGMAWSTVSTNKKN